ncbi:MAG: hypothetical protein EOO62_21635, partial [Hymenobacter sp.]
MMTGALLGVAMAVPAITQIHREGSASATSIAMIGLALASMSPILKQVGLGVRAIGAAGIAGGFKAASKAVYGFLGPIGLAVGAVLAIGTAFVLVNKKMHESSKNAEVLNNSTKAWSQTLGYTSNIMNQDVDKQGASTK